MKVLLCFAFAAIFSLLLSTINANVDFEYEWQILSSTNFSSQIRLHPHALLFVTVPWCGESRSVMKEISQKLAKEQQKYSSIKLMLLNRNVEKALADSLGAAEGVTVLFYHQGMSYKYRGILRVQDILSSAYYFMSLAAEDLPLKRLGNSEDLRTFLGSTDKAVLLLESCGWTSKLLVQHTGNESVQGSLFPGDSNRETNGTYAFGRKKNLKNDGNDMDCDVQHGCGDSPWVGDFSAENGTAFPTKEDMHPSFGTSCTFEEYIKFKSFFSKFMVLARDAYFPHQRQRYGHLADRSILSTVGIEDSDQWLLIISYAGCPGCLRKLRNENYLQSALEMHDQPVTELLDDGNGLGPGLPIDKPSLVLFVDRTSDSLETQEKSYTALNAFKELALQYWKSQQLNWQSIDRPKRSLGSFRGSSNMFQNHRLLLSHSSQINLNDKMSIMIINDGKQVTFGNEASNLQSGSLHEILTYLVVQKKQGKLTSLAKEAGFQLLSDEIDVKIADPSSSQDESQNKDSSVKFDGHSEEGILEKNRDVVADDLPKMHQEKQFRSTTAEAPNEYDNQNESMEDGSKESEVMDSNQSFDDHEVASASDVDFNIHTDTENDNPEDLRHPINVFTGSFFFCDGNYKFLRTLTSDSEVPRIVIIDPLSQQHYVLSKEVDCSVPSVSTFMDQFLNGSLTPYQRSGPLRNTLEVPKPPLVNLDFHEKDFIPCLTAETFAEFVLGSNDSDVQNSANAWHTDVVVLFSSSWCGFCQRMDLLVREVYRALKGYINMAESESKNKELFSQDGIKDGLPKLPAFYSIDCTMNECSWIMKSMGQMEVYPSLLLFPAERKTPFVYNGNMVVTDIVKFIANHGSNSHYLASEKGSLWTDWEKNRRPGNIFRGAFTSGDNRRSSDVRKKHFGTISQNAEIQDQVLLKQNEQAAPANPSIGSFLVATELLDDSNTFSKARILIVGADRGVGFQGLIVNKLISSWDSLPQFQDVKVPRTAPMSFGGPIIQQEMPLVSLTKIYFNNQYPQVLPGLYFLDQLETHSRLNEVITGNESAKDFWFFWGYSGWSWDQLLNEIAEGVWTLYDSNIEDLQWPN